MAIALKTSYDENYKQQAPGRLLLRKVLERCHALWPGRCFEFYTNATPDQLAWATERREMLNLTVYRRPIWARVAAWRRRLHSGREPVEVQVLRLDEDWPADLQQLFAAAESQRIAYGADWLKHLASSVFGDADARVYVLRRDGKALAALPVLLKAAERSVESLSNYYSSLYAPALTATATAAELKPLIAALLADNPGCVSMQFAPMDPAEPRFQALRTALREAGLLPFDYFCHGNWYQPVSGSADAFIEEREGMLRSTIKRAERRLAALGARVEILRKEADIERGIQAFETVYARSWKKPEPYPAFVPGLLRLCARRGWLRLGLLWLDDQPIAAQLWMVANGRAEIYKLAYAQEHKGLAPGTVLSAQLMREVIDVDRVSEVDYLIGDDSYKSQWMSQRRERWGLLAYNPRSLRGLLGWLRGL
jgi:CelD/BcsL family acetyltransferase involved in cellulose biosynthesis